MANKKLTPDSFFPAIFFAAFFSIAFVVIIAIIVTQIKPRRHIEETEFTECYEDLKGRDYRGMVNTSANGHDCLNWDELDDKYWVNPVHFPHAGLGDHNYCRNPDDDLAPWCYVDRISIGWDFCEVSDPRENCSVTTVAPTTTIGIFATTGVPELSECFGDADGGDYRGSVNTTVNGYGCQMWTSQSPHIHSVCVVLHN
uniref:Plasminogen-like n=1 Tax=Saccoglossus kowalevskii TaxID=10224 RepID=A0ABM0MVJ0_SACKO|nr:PREDICTED: plasminogen-like [Saccoglossus kowalevskii]